ncbi:MAG: LD-carboxypeptidase [Saprospiraceae bacterium]|nr:LD-carboxypeptidase [Saprospiraceae bacterium]
MTRRFFQQTISTAFLGGIYQPMRTSAKVIKPKTLKPGDKISLIAPGSALSTEKIEQAVLTCSKLDLVPWISPNASKANGYLAGTDAERLEDLHLSFSDPEIKGIWCLRGGYGCTRLLPEINYALIRKNPKVLIGYSDITAFHQALDRQCNLITFHGPVATSEPTDYSLNWLRKTVMQHEPFTISSEPDAEKNMYTIREGSAQGKIIGGNLSILAALAGTPYQASFSGKIVCIEDIGEKPYRIDRMLVQLFQASDLAQANGIILGQFNDCDPDPGDKSLSLEETLRHQFRNFSGPVIAGFSMGHIDNQCTLPFGIEARFNTNERTLELLEAPTL